MSDTAAGQTRVTVIGGGFCGVLTAKRLEGHPRIQLTLIEPSPVFEYTPGLPRVPFERRAEDKITLPFSAVLSRARVIAGRADTVRPDSVDVGAETLQHDYCVLCTGAASPVPLEDRGDLSPLKGLEDARRIRRATESGGDLLIVGGGLVGTEIAAEFVVRRPDCSLTLVHSKDRLIERNPPRASAYARTFLEKRGAQLIFGERVVKREGHNFITENGHSCHADFGIWAAGIRPNPPPMEWFGEPAGMAANALATESSLQLQGFPTVFVGGDLAGLREEKTAHNAERHAKHISSSILRQIRGLAPLEYRSREAPLVISLGPKHGLFCLPGFALKGRIPGLLKWGIESWILRQYRRRSRTPGAARNTT